MPIVLQASGIFYSQFPALRAPRPALALPAPRQMLALPAPRCAGLLAAPRSDPKIELVFERFDLEELLSGLRLRSLEEMDAELEALAQESRRRLSQLFESFQRRRAG